MSYQPLARRLRPQKFSEIIGQDLVAKMVRASILNNNHSGAYLFSGARGTGKTSLARILAKALNCEQLKEGEPCNLCLPCKEITLSRCPDVFEIDAASNRGIEHIRELKDNINYRPHYCRVKVYIIDEAHMLTNEAFNALLKTLEEPPLNVTFILATTNPKKLPDTILSRCLRFDLQLIALTAIAQRLTQISAEENLNLGSEAVDIIAQKSGGSMRDALVFLETLRNLNQEDLTIESVRSLLGWHDVNEILAILESALAKNLKEALNGLTGLLERGTSVNNLTGDFLKLIRAMIFTIAVDSEDYQLPEFLPAVRQRISELAQKTGLPKLHQAFDLFSDLALKTQKNSFETWLLEITIVRLGQLDDLVGIKELIGAIQETASLTTVPPPDLSTLKQRLRDRSAALKTDNAKDYTAAKDAPAKEATVTETTATEATAKEETAKDTTAKDTTAKEATAIDTAAKEATAIDTAAKEVTAIDTAAKEVTAIDIAAKDTTAKEATAIDTAAKEATAIDTAAKEATAIDTAAKEVTAIDTAATDTTAATRELKNPRLEDWTLFLDSISHKLQQPRLDALLKTLIPVEFNENHLLLSYSNTIIAASMKDEDVKLLADLLQQTYGRNIEVKLEKITTTNAKSYNQIKKIEHQTQLKKVKEDLADTSTVKELQKHLPGTVTPGKITGVTLG